MKNIFQSEMSKVLGQFFINDLLHMKRKKSPAVSFLNSARVSKTEMSGKVNRQEEMFTFHP